jgi:hypothetical protein
VRGLAITVLVVVGLLAGAHDDYPGTPDPWFWQIKALGIISMLLAWALIPREE